MKDKIKVIAIVVVIGFVVILSVILKEPVVYLLAKYHLLPEPEPFTELYFEDHLKLPSKLSAGGLGGKRFRFTVHNLEYKEMDYPYEIREIEGERERTLDSGGFSLKHDKYKTIGVDFKNSTGSGRVKIEICLTEKDQCIHFWME